MKSRVVLLVLIMNVFLLTFLHAEDRFQYGFKFGIVNNGFNKYGSGHGNPFNEVSLDSRMGFTAGAFYDWQAFSKLPYLNVSFGAGYKLLRLSGSFNTADATPVLGEFTNYYHLIDAPIGIKFISSHYRGRPFFGAGLQIDAVVGESQSIDFSNGSTPPAGTTYDTIPPYSSRINYGPYIHGGFEIPTANYFYVLEVKYIIWGQDMFKPETSFYGRDKNEVQITFGIKVR